MNLRIPGPTRLHSWKGLELELNWHGDIKLLGLFDRPNFYFRGLSTSLVPQYLEGMNNIGTKNVEEYLFLADVISFDYANIPGCILDDIRSEGRMALLRARESYDFQKGEFTPYAARAIRNALNSLYAKQLRLQKMFPASLDDPVSSVGPDVNDEDSEVENDGPYAHREIRRRESARVMGSLLGLLTPRERQAIACLRLGNSFREIGNDNGYFQAGGPQVSSVRINEAPVRAFSTRL